MQKELAQQAIVDLQVICPQAFIICGTLLGAVRDADIIAWDKDLDFGVYIEHFNEDVVDDLRKAGFSINRELYWDFEEAESIVDSEYLNCRSKLQMTYLQKDVRICLEIFAPGINGMRYSYAGKKWGVFKIPDQFMCETEHINFMGMEVLAPKYLQSTLVWLYGDNWETPNPNYIGSNEHKKNQKRFLIKF